MISFSLQICCKDIAIGKPPAHGLVRSQSLVLMSLYNLLHLFLRPQYPPSLRRHSKKTHFRKNPFNVCIVLYMYINFLAPGVLPVKHASVALMQHCKKLARCPTAYLNAVMIKQARKRSRYLITGPLLETPTNRH